MSVTIALSSTDFGELLLEAGRQLHTSPQQSHNEMTLPMPARLGKGDFRAIELRQGLTLFFLNYCLDVDLRLETRRDHVLWGSTFCLSGSFSCSVRGFKEDLQFRAGRQNVFVGPITHSVTHTPKGQSIQVVGLYVSPHWLQTWCTDEQSLSPAIQLALQSSGQDLPYCYSAPSTAAIHLALHQLAHCPYQGSLRQLYLESKTLELLTLQLACIPPDPAQGRKPLLCPSDIKRIYRGRDILLQNLAQPPSLLGLARLVGTNDFKLKQGFRQVFGTSAFAYLHEHRMEQARLLLSQKELSVKKIAAAVGYASLGHFAVAFKKRFGVSPSATRGAA